MTTNRIIINNLTKKYQNSVIFENTNLDLKQENYKYFIIYGKSGSGKTTLLNLIAGIDNNYEGKINIILKNKEYNLKELNKKELLKYRREKIGYIFQNFSLIEELNVYENISVPLILNGYKKNEIEKKILILLEKLEIKDIANKNVNNISGGQKQRVAIARAVIHNPEIILADEPTANLDKQTKNEVLKLFDEYLKNKMVLIVTHDESILNLNNSKLIEISNKQINLK